MNKKRNYMDSYSVQILKIYFKCNHQINPKWVGKNNEEMLYRDAYTILNSENEHEQSQPPLPMTDNSELTIKKYAKTQAKCAF